MKCNGVTILLFNCILFLLSICAKGSVILSGDNRRIDLTKQFEIIEEKGRSFSPAELISGRFDSVFSENKIEAKLFGREKRTFWARLIVESRSNKDSEWVFRFWNYYSLIDCYTIYKKGKVTKQKTGWSLALNQRSVYNAELLFNLTLDPNESATVYFYITTDPAWNNPPEVRSEIIAADTWNTIERKHWLLNGLIAGLVIISTVFAILNFFYGKKMYLLSLALSNVIIIFYFLNSNNIISTFLFPYYPLYNLSRYSLIYFCLPAFVASIGLLFITFGELNKILPATSRVYIRLTIVIVLLTVLIPVFSLSASLMRYLYLLFIGWAIFHLVVWINLARKNNAAGKVALICYTSIGIGLFIECLRQGFIIEDNIFVHNAFQVGASLTITISMFTFLNFARKLRKKKIKAQKEKEQLLLEQNIILESKVEQRTSELRIVNDNLSTTLQNLKEAQSSLIKAEKQKETEIIRSRISRDIHDDISSELTKISWMSELIKARSQKNNNSDSSDLIEKINFSSRQTISKLGEIIWAIKPENDNLESFLSYIRNHIANYLEDTSIKYEIDFPVYVPDLIINPEIKRNLYLVLKEALNNSVKYAEAGNIEIVFMIEEANYYFSIADDGNGIDKKVIHGSGNGLQNMKRRMENIGGLFRIESKKNSGTKIVLTGQLF